MLPALLAAIRHDRELSPWLGAALGEAGSAALEPLLALLDDAPPWRQLAIAYGRMEKHGLVSHALAEEAILTGDYRTAIRLSTRAMKVLPEGSPEWLRSQDIEIQAKRIKKEME